MATDSLSENSQAERNKAVFHRWFGEAWNKGHFDVAYQVIDQKMRVHGAGGQPVEQGPDGLIGLIKTWRDAFPDGHMEVNGLIAEGDLVAALLTWHGTQQGEFYGVPASGKRVSCTSIGIDRVRDGVIVDGWGELDMAGMMQTMGALPAIGRGYVSQGRDGGWGQSGYATPGSGSPEESKRLAARFVEAYNAGDQTALEGIVDPARYAEYAPIWGSTDLESSLGVLRALRAALPDLRYTPDPGIVIAEGDQVAIHGVISGTHTGGELFGVAASGKPVSFTQTDLFRVSGGRIVERWVCADTLSIMQQIGATPGPA